MSKSQPLQDISEHCRLCNVPDRYDQGEIDIAPARTICAACRLGGGGIYKFDIAHALRGEVKKQSARPKGKKETYTKRYGHAVKALKEQGRSVREIAAILGISPTSVQKIQKAAKCDNLQIK